MTKMAKKVPKAQDPRGGEVSRPGAGEAGRAGDGLRPELKKLVEEMFESMYAAQGIGLAAPQIGISKRITVIDTSFKKNPEGQAGADQSGGDRARRASR
jgi:hypothetical protein